MFAADKVEWRQELKRRASSIRAELRSTKQRKRKSLLEIELEYLEEALDEGKVEVP